MGIKKKAKGKSKAATNKSPANKSAAKKSGGQKKKGKDIVQVRESINELVKDSAEEIATSVIEVATRTGQLASAKYLFEAVGLYPATEATSAPPAKDTLAHILLTRMGVPTEPVIFDEDEMAAAVAAAAVAAGLANDAKNAKSEGATGAADEPGPELVEEQDHVPRDNSQ